MSTDVTTLSQDELLALRGQIVRELDRRHGGARSARRKGDGEREARPVRYRHPRHPELTWVGLGRYPAWVREWLNSGRDLVECRVD